MICEIETMDLPTGYRMPEPSADVLVRLLRAQDSAKEVRMVQDVEVEITVDLGEVI